jgi:hypothetical protein
LILSISPTDPLSLAYKIFFVNIFRLYYKDDMQHKIIPQVTAAARAYLEAQAKGGRLKMKWHMVGIKSGIKALGSAYIFGFTKDKDDPALVLLRGVAKEMFPGGLEL